MKQTKLENCDNSISQSDFFKELTKSRCWQGANPGDKNKEPESLLTMLGVPWALHLDSKSETDNKWSC